MAISQDIGVVHSEIRAGSFNRIQFKSYLGDLCATLHSRGIIDPIFVLDNCPIHSREDLDELAIGAGIEYRFLPPWSPMLNPIEEVFSDLKRTVRGLLSTTLQQEIIAIDSMPRGGKGACVGSYWFVHTNFLKIVSTLKQSTITSITPNKQSACQSCWKICESLKDSTVRV